MPENVPLYPELTVKEFVSYMAELKLVGRKERKQEVENVIKETGLEEVKNKLIRNLSRGYKQRVSMAGALVGNPEVLILDEPTVGQDYESLKNMVNIINYWHQKYNNTIITITHDFRCIEALADRAIWIKAGVVKKEGLHDVINEFFF